MSEFAKWLAIACGINLLGGIAYYQSVLRLGRRAVKEGYRFGRHLVLLLSSLLHLALLIVVLIVVGPYAHAISASERTSWHIALAFLLPVIFVYLPCILHYRDYVAYVRSLTTTTNLKKT